MTRIKTVSTAPAEPKTHRRASPASKKPAPVPAVPEFDSAAHHDEIARLAYFTSLDRGASPDENWLKAETEVRAKYSDLKSEP